MNIDFINGLFITLGSCFTWKNVFMLYKQKEVKGVYWPTTLFFTIWGTWNLFFYKSLGQVFSFYIGIILVLGNTFWVLLAIKYMKKRKEN